MIKIAEWCFDLFVAVLCTCLTVVGVLFILHILGKMLVP